jgi:hypothetical protein
MAKIQSQKTGRFIKQPLEKRFWEKVNRKSKNECWEWRGSKLNSGYGKMRDSNKRQRPATHISWFIHHRKWPTKLMCHTCDNPKCVNPHHLFEGNYKDNSIDCVGKDRHTRGSRQSFAILTEKDVEEIKKEYTGEHGDCTRLGKKYNVTYSTISKIMRGLQWKHVI